MFSIFPTVFISLLYVIENHCKLKILQNFEDGKKFKFFSHFEKYVCKISILLVKEMGVSSIYTLGGYGLGKLVPEPRVLGAATSEEMVALFKSADVEFIEGEPGAGIVGASGLLLGLGKLQGIQGGCLMGETSGYMVDPKSASVVLKSLQKLLNIEIDLEELEKRAKQVDNITSQLKENESEVEERVDVNYIG